ncbi:hypothetical protein JCM19298_1548 [Nonlabens ulvanivorans]|nr:hypothetical protein JCM19298_1548 [Nonlabens ulvanivorans]
MVEMQAGGTGLPFPIIKTALARDLIVDEGQTLELEYYLKYGNNDLF